MITVEFTKQVQGIEYRTQSWLITAKVLSSSRTNSTSLFKFLRSGDQHFFAGVVSPVDLLEMDEALDENGVPTYYIGDEAKILVRCESDIDEIVKLIKIDLDEFERSLASAEVTQSLGVVSIGS